MDKVEGKEVVKGLRKYHSNAVMVLFKEGALGLGDIGSTRYYKEVLDIYELFKHMYGITYNYILKKCTYEEAITEISKREKNARYRIDEQVCMLYKMLQKHEDMRYRKLIIGC